MFVLPSPELPRKSKRRHCASMCTRCDYPRPIGSVGGICGISERLAACDPSHKTHLTFISQGTNTRVTKRDFAAILTNSRQHPDISSLANLRAGRDQESSAINGCLTLTRSTWLTGRPAGPPVCAFGPPAIFQRRKFHPDFYSGADHWPSC